MRFMVLVLVSLFVVFPAAAQETDRDFGLQLARAALKSAGADIQYNGAYVLIDYPWGDVPAGQGVCTDVVIRSLRAVGLDLQQLVHEDMKRNFRRYPKIWGLKRPDPNIDHRRVPNLQTFFSRHGESLTVSDDPDDYQPGDLVTWMLPRNLPHIGIVVDRRSADGRRPLIVHNIGWGPELEDMLFDFPITGHYRYQPSDPN